MARYWRDRDRDEALKSVARMTKAGLSASQIQAETGISKSTIWKMRRELGITGRQNRPWTQEEIDLATKLFDDGCSLKEVCRTVGRPMSSVRTRFPGRKWSDETTVEHNRALHAFKVDMEKIK